MTLQYIPYVVKAIISIEEAVEDLPGQNKKQLIIDSVKSTTGSQMPQADLDALSKIVDTQVQVLNNSGYFTKGNKQ